MTEKVLLKAVVVFVVIGGKVLLAKKINKDKELIKIGQGRWNGYGGGVEAHESELEAAIREIREETRGADDEKGGIIIGPQNIHLRAVVFCHNTKSDGRIFKCRLSVYMANAISGSLADSEEMICATWFSSNEIPYEWMIPTDIDWLPSVLGGELLLARVFLGASQTVKLKETQIRKMARLPM